LARAKKTIVVENLNELLLEKNISIEEFARKSPSKSRLSKKAITEIVDKQAIADWKFKRLAAMLETAGITGNIKTNIGSKAVSEVKSNPTKPESEPQAEEQNDLSRPSTEKKKTLTLKGSGISQGTVRQNFSHGRSKSVVVETRKRRINKPGEIPLEDQKSEEEPKPLEIKSGDKLKVSGASKSVDYAAKRAAKAYTKKTLEKRLDNSILKAHQLRLKETRKNYLNLWHLPQNQWRVPASVLTCILSNCGNI